MKTCKDNRKVSGDFVSYNCWTAVESRTVLHIGVIEPGVHLSQLEDKDKDLCEEIILMVDPQCVAQYDFFQYFNSENKDAGIFFNDQYIFHQM